MKWREIGISTREEHSEIIGEFLYRVGAGGVVIEDPRMVSEYLNSNVWDAHEVTLPDIPLGMVMVKAYLPVNEELEEKLACLKEELTRFRCEECIDETLDWVSADLQEEDWANAWKAYFKPERIGERIVVKPSWENYIPTDTDLVIELDPGMAFGTGNHPTTALCIQALEEWIEPEMVVYDVGTGSGVLSLAAALLGAEQVCAIDLDPVAVRVAQENVAVNKLEDTITVSQGDLLTLQSEQADLVVANIVADVIKILAPDVPRLLKPDGIFIASGIIGDRLDEVVEAVQELPFVIEEIASRGDWNVLVVRRAEGK